MVEQCSEVLICLGHCFLSLTNFSQLEAHLTFKNLKRARVSDALSLLQLCTQQPSAVGRKRERQSAQIPGVGGRRRKFSAAPEMLLGILFMQIFVYIHFAIQSSKTASFSTPPGSAEPLFPYHPTKCSKKQPGAGQPGTYPWEMPLSTAHGREGLCCNWKTVPCLESLLWLCILLKIVARRNCVAKKLHLKAPSA